MSTAAHRNRWQRNASRQRTEQTASQRQCGGGGGVARSSRTKQTLLHCFIVRMHSTATPITDARRHATRHRRRATHLRSNHIAHRCLSACKPRRRPASSDAYSLTSLDSTRDWRSATDAAKRKASETQRRPWGDPRHATCAHLSSEAGSNQMNNVTSHCRSMLHAQSSSPLHVAPPLCSFFSWFVSLPRFR